MRTNKLIEDLIARIDGQGLGDLASWIGMEARTEAPTAYAGGPIALDAKLPTVSDAAEMIVTRADGTEVTRYPIDPRETTHRGTPVMPDGTPLDAGTYAFTAQPYASGGDLLSVKGGALCRRPRP